MCALRRRIVFFRDRCFVVIELHELRRGHVFIDSRSRVVANMLNLLPGPVFVDWRQLLHPMRRSHVLRSRGERLFELTCTDADAVTGA